MAVNRYDQAYISPYVEQYTPIPFDALLRVGQQYAQDRDKTEAAFQNALTQYRDFNSPSAVDTQRWYDLTVAPATQLANEIASNPELLRSPEGRRRIQNFINTRPYAELSQLERSRDQMIQRQKNIAELIKDGTYNTAWHNLNMSNYDTLKQGIFSDINVTPYKTTFELVKPYIDGIDDSYIRTQGGFDYYGVTPERIQQVVGANINSLLSSPQGVEYMRQYIRQGYSPADAQKLLANELISASAKFAHENRKTNPFATMQYNDQLIRRRWADPNNPANRDKNPDNPRNPNYLTNSLQRTGIEQYAKARIDLLSTIPGYRQANDVLRMSNDQQRIDGANAVLEDIDAKTQNPQQLFKTVFANHGTIQRDGTIAMNKTQLEAATNDVLTRFSVPISGTYGNLLLNTIPGISEDYINTPLGRRRTISSGANLDLVTRGISAIAGFDSQDSNRNKFLNELKGGGFNNMIVMGNERTLTLPSSDSQGNFTTTNYQTVRVAISADEAKARGLTDEDMKQAGAVKYSTPSRSTSSNTLSGTYDNDNGETNYEKSSSSSSITSGNTYWMVNLMSEIPIEQVGAEYLNQQALKQNVNSTTYSALYQDVQDQAFGYYLLNNE